MHKETIESCDRNLLTRKKNLEKLQNQFAHPNDDLELLYFSRPKNLAFYIAL
jgi:hypothetical protein